MSELGRRRADATARPGARAALASRPTTGRELGMLWLIIGIILLVVAIAGGAIVHPILFALGIAALVIFLMNWRGR
jgi:hypothetical protein